MTTEEQREIARSVVRIAQILGSKNINKATIENCRATLTINFALLSNESNLIYKDILVTILLELRILASRS